jgi:hypothetical protein
MKVEWRRLGALEVDHELVWGLVGLTAAAMACVAVFSSTVPVLLCPFREMTGMACPTCGATRALIALLKGDVMTAFRMNPVVAAATSGLVPYLAYAVIAAAFGLPRVRLRFSATDWVLCRATVVAVTLATWAFLIVDGR